MSFKVLPFKRIKILTKFITIFKRMIECLVTELQSLILPHRTWPFVYWNVFLLNKLIGSFQFLLLHISFSSHVYNLIMKVPIIPELWKISLIMVLTFREKYFQKQVSPFIQRKFFNSQSKWEKVLRVRDPDMKWVPIQLEI